MSKIFISHCSADNASALAVAQWLEANGWDDYFLDFSPARGLAPGERWQEALKVAADRCEAVIFLISPSWRDSRWCLAEFLLAKQLQKTIFGVLVETTPLKTLPPEMTAEWQLCNLVTGAERQGFHVRHHSMGHETEVSFADAGLVLLRTGLQRAGLGATTFPWPPPSDPMRAPYRGLKALEADDAAVLFGRDASTVRGMDALRGMRECGVERMLVILGGSGAGKSSFLRAGLFPRLVRDDRHFLPLPVIRPERAVMTGGLGLISGLERAFANLRVAKNRAHIRRALQQPEGLESLLLELQARATARLTAEAPPPTVVFLLDQGEELFDPEGRSEAEHLLSLLALVFGPFTDNDAGTMAARQRALAIIAIRSDSYERLQTESRLEGVKHALFSLPPIPRTEFRQVIDGPAQRSTMGGRRLTVAPALADQLLVDAEGADALPLLAFTLERLLLEHGSDNELTLSNYTDLGGVSGSIQAAVEAAVAEPGREPQVPWDQKECERRFRQGFIPWLAYVDPDTEERKRRVADWDEEIPDETRPLLERLIDQRLLVRDRRMVGGRLMTTVEVAHEALLRRWPALTAWLDEEAANLKALEVVRRAASDWDRNARGEAWLIHTGERLQVAQILRQRPNYDQLMSHDGRAYLESCSQRDEATRSEREAQVRRIAAEQARRAEESERRAQAEAAARRAAEQAATANRTRFQIAVAASIVTVVLAGVTALLFQNARTQANNAIAAEVHAEAETARAEAEAANARTQEQYAQSQAETARVQSARATAATARAEFRNAVKGLVTGQAAEGLAHLAAAIRTATETDSARALAAATLSHRRWFLPIGSLQHEEDVQSAHFSPDGTRILTSTDDRSTLWNVSTGAVVGEPLSALAQFSPDGNQVVTVSSFTVEEWDARTGAKLGETELNHTVNSVALSPDCTRVVTVSEDDTATARLWDARTGDAIGKPMQHGAEVRSAHFGPDGTRVLTVSEDNTVRLWDARTGAAIGNPMQHHAEVRSAHFGPDGTRVVTESEDNTARLWDARTGAAIGKPMPHGVEPWRFSPPFSPDGTRIVTSEDKTARLWDARNGTAIGGPMQHEQSVTVAQFSADGERFVTASWYTAHLWDARTAAALGRPLQHANHVMSAQFSPDGTRVVTGSADRTVRLWDARTGAAIGESMRHETRVQEAQFSPDGTYVLTLSMATAWLWDTRTEAALGEPLPHADVVISARFSRDGTRVVTASADATARVWDTRTGAAIGEPMRHDDRVDSAQFSPDGTRVVTASDDATARLWDARTGAAIGEPMRHDDEVNSAQFSPDGSRVVTASDDATARLWDARSGAAIGEPMRDDDGDIVDSAQFSADGTRVVTTMFSTARQWDARTGAAIGEPIEKAGSAQFSPDGTRLVTAYLGGSLQMRDAHTGVAVGEPIQQLNMINSTQFSPDGTRVVTGSEDGTAQVWDVRTGAALGEPMQHAGYLRSAQFSPDGMRVVTASNDGAKVWDAGTGVALGEPLHLSQVMSAEFSADGTRVVTAAVDGTARVWEAIVPSVDDAEILAALVEAVSGLTVSEFGAVVPLPERIARLDDLRRRTISSERISSDPVFEALFRWFFANPVTRTISPLSDMTPAEYRSRVAPAQNHGSTD